MSKTNIGFVAFAKQALAGGTGYVYGTIGQLCTASLLNNCAARYPANNLAGGQMRKVGNKWLGRRVTDCIGLLKYYMMSDGYGKNPCYISKYDQSANGAFQQAREKGPINTLPEIPGICLHMPGHFGVYIGGGYAIEAKGTCYGVVKTKVAGRGWTHWFKSPWLDYVSTSTVTVPDVVVSDTTADMALKKGSTYTVKLTALHKPNFTVGNGTVLQTHFGKQKGCNYYFAVKAIGKVGDCTRVFADGKVLFAVTIS